MERLQRLQNEVAVVTGSDSGIGKAIALAFAAEGAAVAVTYLHDKIGATDTARRIEEQGGHAETHYLDQRESPSVAQLFDRVKQSFGTPTILVNAAGIDALGIPVKDMTDEQWDDALRSNLSGPFYCCREFIRAIDGTGRHGTILNITSVHQEIPRSGASGYDVSKGGLRNLTTTLALELAEKNINVNNIAPGMVLTPMNQKAIDDPEFLKKEVQSIPVKRAAQPEEIAHAAVFLASKEARYVHGTTLVVDGGLMLFQGQGA